MTLGNLVEKITTTKFIDLEVGSLEKKIVVLILEEMQIYTAELKKELKNKASRYNS
jgi:hypothetical protein